jgi:hypothetical protein
MLRLPVVHGEGRHAFLRRALGEHDLPLTRMLPAANAARLCLADGKMALGLVMAANRSDYLYFVVGPRSVLILAGVVALFAFWIHAAVPR